MALNQRKLYGTLPSLVQNTQSDNVSQTEVDYSSSINRSEEQPLLINQLVTPKRIKSRKIILGVIFSLSTGLFFTGSNFLIQEYQADVSDVLLIRHVILLLMLLFYKLIRRDEVLPEKNSEKVLVIVQGITTALSVITGVAYLSFMPVADGLTLINCSPAVTIFLSSLLLKVRLTTTKSLAAICLTFGGLFVCQPPAIFGSSTTSLSSQRPKYVIGVVIATSSCVFTGLTNVLVHKATKNVSLSTLGFWAAVCGVGISMAFSLISPDGQVLTDLIVSLKPVDWLIILSSAGMGLLAFILLAVALKVMNPSLVTSLRTLTLVAAFAFQSLLSWELPNTWEWIGGLLVIIGVFFVCI